MTRCSVIPPVIVSPDTLPLLDSQINWDRFERFVLDLIQAQPGIQYVKRYGKSGSKQKGIDLIAVLNNSDRWAFQCKQYSVFKLSDAKKTVAKASYDAKRYFLVIACRADSQVHDYIDTQEGWELWDVERVSNEVLKLPRENARRLVTRSFGAAWCKAFLGIGGTSPFLPWKIYFSRWLDQDRLFNHNWQLVGRTEMLASLNHFCGDERKRVAILVGRGGIGKSKLLHSFAEAFSSEFPEDLLWFVNENMPLDQQNVDEITSERSVVVIDDAHRFDDLGPLLSAAVQPGSRTKLLLSTRPQRLDYLRAELTRSGFDYTQISALPELKHLNRNEVRELARQALGKKFVRLERALANATWDCPLVTVVGGKLLAESAMDPRLLVNHDGFRAEVLNRFQDIIVGRIADGQDPKFYAELLQMLSATAPFSVEDAEFFKTAADFLRTKVEDVVKAIGDTCAPTTAQEHPGAFKFTPDVLADHILHQVCVAANGFPTGYADRVFTAFSNTHPERVFLNLAELDWRMHALANPSSLLTAIWKSFEDRLRNGKPDVKASAISLISSVAYYQPEKAMQMVELALKHLPPLPKRKLTWLEVSYRERILQMLPGIFRRCAYTLECVPRAARYLWELGKRDARQLNQCPDHPFRLLKEVAAYGRDKPFVFYESVLDTVVPWLSEPGIHNYAHSVIDILDGFLAKTGEDTWTDGREITWGKFRVNRERTVCLREKAFKAVCSCAEIQNLEIVLRVIKSLESVLHSNLQLLCGEVTESDVQQWEPDQLAAVAAIDRIIDKHNDPIIHFRCLNALREQIKPEQSKKVLHAAKAAASHVPQTFELRLVQTMARDHDRSWRKLSPDLHVAHNLHEEQVKEFHARVARELIKKYPKARSGLKLLDGLLTPLRESEIAVWETPFLTSLAEADVAYTDALCAAIVTCPTTAISGYFSIFLNAAEAFRPLGRYDLRPRGRGMDFWTQALCARAQLHSLARQRGLTRGELGLLSRLLNHRQKAVVRNSLNAIRWIGKEDPKAAMRLLAQATWENDKPLASIALSCIDAQQGIPPDKMQDRDIKSLLRRLERTPDIEDYEIGEFLGHASERCPIEAAKMFINRIKRSVGRKSEFDERPLPYDFQHPLPDLSKHPRGAIILTQIRDMTLNRKYSYFARELFWLLAPQGFCLELLKEWISAHDQLKFDGALDLLQDEESGVVFVRPDFVAFVLNHALEVDNECFKRAKSTLLFSATRHGESRAVGQPGPATLATKERAIGLSKTFPPGSMMAEFYLSIAKYSEAQLAQEKLDDEEILDPD